MEKNFFWSRMTMLITLMYSNFAWAQPKELSSAQWSVSAGITANKRIITDESFSALPFSGIQPGAIASFYYSNKRSSHSLGVGWQQGRLSPENSDAASLQQRSVTVSYCYRYIVTRNQEAPVQLSIGPAVDFAYNHRQYAGFINKERSFDFAAALGASVQFSWNLNQMSSGLSLTDHLDFAFLTGLLVPGFEKEEALTGTGFTTLALFRDGHIAGPGAYRGYKNCLALARDITPHSRLAITYAWSYSAIEEDEAVRQANHQLSLVLTYIL